MILRGKQQKRFAAGALAVLTGLALVACGDDDSGAASDIDAAGLDVPDCGDVAGEPNSVDAGAVSANGADLPDGYMPVTVVGDPLAEHDGSQDPAVCTPAPALSGTDYAGEPVSFSPADDGATLLVFLAHWCPHCNDEIPEMLEWDAAGDVPDDLNIVGISTAVDASRPNFPPDEWLDEREWPWPVIADSDTLEAALAYGLSAFPFMVLVDDDGLVLARASGAKDPEALTAFTAPVAG